MVLASANSSLLILEKSSYNLDDDNDWFVVVVVIAPPSAGSGAVEKNRPTTAACEEWLLAKMEGAAIVRGMFEAPTIPRRRGRNIAMIFLVLLNN
mmetsp:Transcript_4664/g.8887  ORF Transcript_4664/g.8887 Transcript_4664/m.8887 type:complete len:95 (+) Transcript_4664:328-612(+)